MTRRLLITGGTSGIGLACAVDLLAAGDEVWVTGSRAASVEDARARLPGATVEQIDTCSESEMANLADTLTGVGGLDGLVVNAGVDGEGRPLVQTRPASFRRVIETNVVGAFLAARALVPVLHRPGAVVFTASVNALRPEAGFADYNASKAAVVSLARTLALELGGEDIVVTSVCPGYVPTPMTTAALGDPAIASELQARIPLGRFGAPEEIAALVTFLLGPRARFLHGAVIPIAGGSDI